VREGKEEFLPTKVNRIPRGDQAEWRCRVLFQKGVQSIQVPTGVDLVLDLYGQRFAVDRNYNVDLSIVSVSPIQRLGLRARIEAVYESLCVIIDYALSRPSRHGRICQGSPVKSTQKSILRARVREQNLSLPTNPRCSAARKELSLRFEIDTLQVIQIIADSPLFDLQQFCQITLADELAALAG
jgi:hypothetical protein